MRLDIKQETDADVLFCLYVQKLLDSGHVDAVEDVMRDYHAGEPGIALDGAVFYANDYGLDIPEKVLKRTLPYLEPDSYGLKACRKLLKKDATHAS